MAENRSKNRGSNKRRNTNKNKQIKGGTQTGVFPGQRFDGKEYAGKAVFDEKHKFLGKFIDYDINRHLLRFLPAGFPDKFKNYRIRFIKVLYFEDKFSLNKLFGFQTTAAESSDPNNFVDYDKYLKKSGISVKIQEDEEDDEEWGVEHVEEDPVSKVGGKTKRRKHNRRNNKSKRIKIQ
jgi:hypothetical protein